MASEMPSAPTMRVTRIRKDRTRSLHQHRSLTAAKMGAQVAPARSFGSEIITAEIKPSGLDGNPMKMSSSFSGISPAPQSARMTRVATSVTVKHLSQSQSRSATNRQPTDGCPSTHDIEDPPQDPSNENNRSVTASSRTWKLLELDQSSASFSSNAHLSRHGLHSSLPSKDSILPPVHVLSTQATGSFADFHSINPSILLESSSKINLKPDDKTETKFNSPDQSMADRDEEKGRDRISHITERKEKRRHYFRRRCCASLCPCCSPCCCLLTGLLAALLLALLATLIAVLISPKTTRTTTTTSTTTSTSGTTTTTTTSTSTTSTTTTSVTTTTSTSTSTTSTSTATTTTTSTASTSTSTTSVTTTTSTSTSSTTSTATTTTSETTTTTSATTSVSSTTTSATTMTTATTATAATTVTITLNSCTTGWSGVTLFTFCTNCPDINPYQQYTYTYVAIATQTRLTFVMREDNGYYALDDVSVRSTSAPSVELLSNPGFESGSFSPWIHCNPAGSSSPGVIHATSPAFHYGGYTYAAHGGSYYYLDGAVSYADYLSQLFPTVIGQSYTISFWLYNQGSGSSSDVEIVLSI